MPDTIPKSGEGSRRAPTRWLVSACVCAAGVAGFTLFAHWNNRRIAEEAKLLGTPVIQALERYKAAKNELPGALDDLVPGYLPAVPGCEAGSPRQMAYYPESSRSHYQLACPGFVYKTFRYRSANQRWNTDD